MSSECAVRPGSVPDWLPELATRTRGLKPSAIGSVLRLADSPDILALAAGSPARETFCVQEVNEATKRLLVNDPDLLQYGDTQGLPALREWITEHVGHLAGRRYDTTQVVVTHGSQQALDLICKALLDPGDVVVVDQPSYVGALHVLNVFQATVTPVPLASDSGLKRLERTLASGLQVKMIYVVSNYANPTGLTLSKAQRATLVELARRYRCLVVEDDPYGELRYSGAPERPAPIAALSDDVVRLGSFSKVLFPAARIGYMTAPQGLATVLNNLKQAADLGNSNFVQQVVYELISEPGFVSRQVKRANAIYCERRNALAGSLRRFFGDELDFTVPDGGFFIWARLTGHASAHELLTEALAEKVSFVPGGAFYAAEPDESFMRLSFSCTPAENMVEATARLYHAWTRLLQARPLPGHGCPQQGMEIAR